jgi:dynein-related subfamily AAA family protein
MSRSKHIVAATIKNSSATYQLALFTNDRTIELHVRNAPTTDVTHTRWATFDVPASFWPTQSIKKRKTCVATIENTLKPKISGEGPFRIQGFTAIELTDDDNKALDSAKVAVEVFDRVEKALDEKQPRGWSLESHLALAEFLADGIILALDAEDSLDPWTTSLVGKKSAVVMSDKDLDPIELPGEDGGVVPFYPRRSGSGSTDVQKVKGLWTRHLAGFRNFAYLRGEPGAGKTSVVFAGLLDLYKPLGLKFEDHFVVNGNEMTKVSDFKGQVIQDVITGKFTFKKGPLAWAMECGVPLFVDEAPRIRPDVLAVLLSVMASGYVEMPPESGMGTLYAKKGFWVILAGNPSDLGARMSKAIDSRSVIQPWYPTDYGNVRRIIGGEYDELITVARMMEAERKAGRASWAPQTRECIAFKTLTETPEIGFDEAVSNLCSLPKSPRDQDTIRRLVTTNMGVTDIPDYAW